jgi:hypothetical protein
MKQRDFTIRVYLQLIDAMRVAGYSFQRFDEFLLNPKSRVVILRHDVDKRPENSLMFAKLQFERGLKGVYYFRAKKCSWNEKIIREIAEMGHEIGYHYENLATVHGNLDKALIDFQFNIDKLRKIVPVSTICMHGSPLSKYDNRDIWKLANYREYQIIGEPYFDIDFNKMLYLTDTGRAWNAGESSIRDKVKTNFSFSFTSTVDILKSIDKNELPDKIMFNFHPQRWNENLVPWLIELFTQQAKNPIKKIINSIQT